MVLCVGGDEVPPALEPLLVAALEIVEALLNLPLKAQRTSKEVVRPNARLIDTGRFRRRDGFFRECPSHVVIEVENAETREPNVRIRKIFARTIRLKDLASPFVLLLRARVVRLLLIRAPKPQLVERLIQLTSLCLG